MQAFVQIRRVIQGNLLLTQRLSQVEERQTVFQIESDQKFEQIFRALDQGAHLPAQGVFFDGQVYDEYAFVSDLIRSARQSIQLVDNYVDDSVLTLLTKRSAKVSATIYTKSISSQFQLDLQKHKQQYPPIQVVQFSDSHDRILIIDYQRVYHLGASLKDLGRKWFAFSLIEREAFKVVDRLGMGK